MKELDREYEANNNANMDNGVFNTEDEKSRQSQMSVGPSHDTIHQGNGGGEFTKERVNESMEIEGQFLKREEDYYNLESNKSEIDQV